MSNMRNDQYWMQLAITEARKGIGLTSPNPPVGAVIIKGKELLGKGWHSQAGKAHAEREAIADALRRDKKDILQGATIYITLEPCSSHGRTPPCTQAILDAGISHVIYGAKDPNPEHAGCAEVDLKAAGVSVTTGVCEQECQHMIRAFTKVQQTGLPWVILKSALSLDGRITRTPNESQWLTSPASREIVQQLRYESDAIITGGNTARTDDPALTVRSANLPKKKQPWRMVVTQGSKPDLPAGLQLFTDDHADRTLVQEGGDLHAALRTLVEKGCNSVLVEAGGTLMGAMLEAGLADEVAIFYAPMLTGGPNTGFAGSQIEWELRDQHFSCIGDDILLRASIKHPV